MDTTQPTHRTITDDIRDIRERETATAALAQALATILRTTPDHDACVNALRDAAWAADERAFVGVDHRGVCTWVSTGPCRAFISRTGTLRTLWTVESGCAVRLAVVGMPEQLPLFGEVAA